MRVKKQILFTIKGKKFSSLDETNLILQDLKFHAEWIHPSLRNQCQVTADESEWMDSIAKEREFEKIKNMAESGKPLTRKQIRILYDF